MKEFLVAGKERLVPTSWSEIKLCQYLDAIKIEEAPDEQFKGLLSISHFTGIPLVDLKRTPLPELHKLGQAMQFLREDIPHEMITEFKLGEHTYYLTQNLLQTEAQDYFALEKILDSHDMNTITALPKILTIMCKRLGESLDTIDIHEREKVFLDPISGISVQTAESVRVFFSTYVQILSTHSAFYLNRNKIIQAQADATESSIQRLDGMGRFGRCLGKTLRKYNQSLLCNWKIFSGGIVSEPTKENSNTTSKKFTRKMKV